MGEKRHKKERKLTEFLLEEEVNTVVTIKAATGSSKCFFPPMADFVILIGSKLQNIGRKKKEEY